MIKVESLFSLKLTNFTALILQNEHGFETDVPTRPHL